MTIFKFHEKELQELKDLQQFLNKKKIISTQDYLLLNKTINYIEWQEQLVKDIKQYLILHKKLTEILENEF